MTDAARRRGWLSRERALVLVLVAATAIAVYLCYLLAKPFFPALAWALALAIVAYPVHVRLRARLRRPTLAAVLMVLLVALVVVVPFILVARGIIHEAASGIQALTTEDASERWRASLERSPRLAPLVHWLEEQIDVQSALGGLAGFVSDRLPAVLYGGAWAVVELLVALLALFYFFRDRSDVLGTVRSLVPLSHKETDAVFARVRDTVHATIYGSLAVALLQGTLAGLIAWLTGLPAPLLWGAMVGLLAIVAMTFAGWAAAAIVLGISGSWGMALAVAGAGALLIALVDNVLYPTIVGQRLQMHPLAAFLAIVGGVLLFGASGLILGPVVLAVTDALIEVWRRRTAGGRPAERDLASAA